MLESVALLQLGPITLVHLMKYVYGDYYPLRVVEKRK